MPKITPHLWYDKEARQAAELYTSVFENSAIQKSSTLKNTPSGTVELLSIQLAGQEFRLISAGPLFKFTPAISFLVACRTKHEVDAIWKPLSEGGSPLMELGSYSFSEWYGWTTDRFGLSWQVMFMGDWKFSQKFTPTLMFTGSQAGKAEEAIGFYTSAFPNSSKSGVHRYNADEAPDREGTLRHAEFTLDGQPFAAMDSARVHGFGFNEAISFVVDCNDQQELDHYWNKMSAVPESEQCGWLKDEYGVSWQIVPLMLGDITLGKDEAKRARVTQAFLKMKKLNIAKLLEAAQTS